MEMEVSNDENTVEDFNNIVCISGNECRICLKKCFNPCQLFENDKEIPRKLMSFAAVQVVEGDGLPTSICLTCYQLLETSYKFKCQIQKTDVKLREILSHNPSLHSGNKESASVKSFIADIVSNVCEEKALQCPEQNINICEGILTDDCTNTINAASAGKSYLQQSEDYSHETTPPIAENNNIFNNVQTTGQYKEEVLDIEGKASVQAEQDLHNTNISNKQEDIVSDQETKDKEHSEAGNFSTRQVEDICTDDHVEKDTPELICSKEDKSLTSQIHYETNSGSTEFCTSKLSSSRPETVSEKPTKTKLCYVCYICDKQFSSVVKLKGHIVDKHNFMETGKTATKKNVQDKRTRKSSLKEEQEVKNCDDKLNATKVERKNQEFTCKVCFKRFAYRKSFLSHTKTHPEYKSKPLNNEPPKGFDTTHNARTNVNISKESKFEDDEDQKDEDDDDEGDDEDDGDLPIKSLQCTQCGKLFATKRNLKRHISTHSGVKYECLTCGKEFSRIDKLKDHEQSKHKEEMFGQSEEEENEYDEDASYENKLQYGIENRKKDKQHNRPHKCSLCPKAFAHPQSLANHTERHKRVKDTQKRFLCEVCSKCFAQSGSLVAHMRTHTGVKPYVCNVCSRAFTKSTYLQLHLRTHSGEKPYICQYCSRAFARANTLARHITMHTGEAKYHCQICTKSFRRLTSLNEHTYTHTGQRPYACKICTKRYNNAGSLYAHTKKCKAQRLSGTSALPGSIDNSVEHNGSPMSQVLIYSQKKFVDNTTVNQVTPTSQYMIANVHNQKALPSNVIQQFTPDDQNLYTINTKQLKNPYYAIYPNM